MGAQLVPAANSEAATARGVVVLQITAGAHSGVVLPIEADVCRIGASAESDIVLSDAGVVEDHAALRIDRGRVHVEARGGEVSLAGGSVVPKGQGCRVRLPADIRIGSSTIRLTGGPAQPFWLQPPLAAVACVALLLVGSIVATQAGFVGGDAEGSAPRAALARPAVLAAATPATDPATALGDKIAASGLQGLKVETAGDRIVVRGAIEDAARPAWAAAQRWFDETYGGRYVLASEVGSKSAAARPRFQLQAIWFGPSPYVVTADGQRRYAGATLSDGWVLKEIRENKVVVAKAGEEVALSY